jgi:hypothetical protein
MTAGYYQDRVQSITVGRLQTGMTGKKKLHWNRKNIDMTTLTDIVKILHEHSYWETIPGGAIKLVNKNKAAKAIVDLITQNEKELKDVVQQKMVRQWAGKKRAG